MKKQPLGATLWFTGLPCAGKTTLARAVGKALLLRGHAVELLDGDAVRKNLSSTLGFSKKDRMANVARVAFMAEVLTRQGVMTLVSLVSPYRSMRADARRGIGSFIEIYVCCPLRVCEKRDVKGMYRLARQGKISRFTGVSDPYEEPLKPEIILDTDRMRVGECVETVLNHLKKQNLLLPANPFPRNRLLSKAFEFAAYHHRGQERKGGLPYITHPVAVANTLHEAGCRAEIVAAALLHDVLEDTGCDLEEMRCLAGARIARWVTQITDKDKTVPWRVRKTNYLKSLQKASREALAVACADKTDNIRSLAEGLKNSGSRFGRLFSGKMKDKVKNYEKIYELIRSRYPNCPMLADYDCHLKQLKNQVHTKRSA